jgi:hypothetical protein
MKGMFLDLLVKSPTVALRYIPERGMTSKIFLSLLQSRVSLYQNHAKDHLASDMNGEEQMRCK